MTARVVNKTTVVGQGGVLIAECNGEIFAHKIADLFNWFDETVSKMEPLKWHNVRDVREAMKSGVTYSPSKKSLPKLGAPRQSPPALSMRPVLPALPGPALPQLPAAPALPPRLP